MSDDVVDLLVIGGGPAGLAAVRAYRGEGGRGRVVVVSADPDAPYDRPPLSKDFLAGQHAEGELDLLEEGEAEQLGMTWLRDRVVAVDPAGRRVMTRDGSEFTYRWCLFATGSNPAGLSVPGGEDGGVLRLRTLEDARRLRQVLGQAVGRPRTVAVIGSGFVGCEVASSLCRPGLDVVLVTEQDVPQEDRLGTDAGARIAGWLVEDGVRLVTGVTVTAIEPAASGVTIRLDGAADVPADEVLVAVGAVPVVGLAAEAGLELEEGRILVDTRMRSSIEGVLAAGDVARAYNTSAGRELSVEHWFDAETTGRIAGQTAAGNAEVEWAEPTGFWSRIGDRWLKYAAWGDGYVEELFEEGEQGGFTVWYEDENGTCVGALTYLADDDYDKAFSLLS